jgi:hypothetical protein
MKRRLHSNNQDSLELLLDTLCNVFGGIILIACLLAMLSRPKPEKQTANEVVNHESGILLEKKIEQACAELDGLQKLRSQLQSEDDPSTRPLIDELQALKKTADQKRLERAAQDEQAASKADQVLRDAGKEVARLREQEQTLERKLGLMNKETEAVRERQAAAKKRLSDLQLELDNLNALKVEKLRLPRERQIAKKPAPVIVRFGQVFPLYDTDAKPMSMVDHVSSPDGNFTAMPKAGQGFHPIRDAQRLRQFLPRLVGKNRYLTLYVYPDSYATFRDLKLLIFELGLDYGIDICAEHRVLIFNPDGEKPAPL